MRVFDSTLYEEWKGRNIFIASLENAVAIDALNYRLSKFEHMLFLFVVLGE